MGFLKRMTRNWMCWACVIEIVAVSSFCLVLAGLFTAWMCWPMIRVWLGWGL